MIFRNKYKWFYIISRTETARESATQTDPERRIGFLKSHGRFKEKLCGQIFYTERKISTSVQYLSNQSLFCNCCHFLDIYLSESCRIVDDIELCCSEELNSN